MNKQRTLLASSVRQTTTRTEFEEEEEESQLELQWRWNEIELFPAGRGQRHSSSLYRIDIDNRLLYYVNQTTDHFSEYLCARENRGRGV